MRLNKIFQQLVVALGRITPAFAPVPNEFPKQRHAGVKASSVAHEPPRPLSTERIANALDFLNVYYLSDRDEHLLAMWDRHAVLFKAEGPDCEILVCRAKPFATIPRDSGAEALNVLNEWNHTRRFMKAYLGDPTERGQLPIYCEIQTPLGAGIHDELLIELVDAAAAVATSFVEFLYDQGVLADAFSTRRSSGDKTSDG
ncbi:YbjN domain-containing protein [Micromonospora sp. NPDC005324]|uniref:YbjN domain-containing protein n=1 Tax=Micromonospora sp. NPDC005324 TaxID=3157033 RepID=UPI0033A56FF2